MLQTITSGSRAVPENENLQALFGDVDVNGQALSLFRILFSCLLLFDLFVYVLPHWGFLYGAEGVFTARERQSELLWSFLSYSDNATFQIATIALYCTALLGFLIGYQTRLCAFLCFLLLTLMLDRNPASYSNAEMLQTLLLLWCCFMPMDRYWSVEAARRPEQARHMRWPVVPVIALKTQVLLIYFCSALFKLASDDWLAGNAIIYSLSDNVYGSFYGYRIAQFIPHSAQLMACCTIIVLQLLFSVFVYLPLKHYQARAFALVAAALMHISFIFLLQLHLFPYLCLIYLILLFPDQWITRILSRRRQRLETIRIFYDPDCGFCKSAARLFREFCLSPYTPVKPSDCDEEAHQLLREHNSWIVYGSDQQVYMKAEAVAYICRQSPVFWIFGVFFGLPGVRMLMARGYDWIGRNRNRLGSASRVLLAPKSFRYPDMTQQWICLGLLVIMLTYSLWAVPQVKRAIPADLRQLALQTRTLQVWDLFAPYPVAYTRSLRITAIDQQSKPINLKPYTDAHFELQNGYFEFSSPRIFKFYNALYGKRNPRHRLGYARYMCWKTHATTTPAKVVQLELSIKHNFKDFDQYRIKKAYQCEDIMLAQS